jgi:hypothetical protein
VRGERGLRGFKTVLDNDVAGKRDIPPGYQFDELKKAPIERCQPRSLIWIFISSLATAASLPAGPTL